MCFMAATKSKCAISLPGKQNVKNELNNSVFYFIFYGGRGNELFNTHVAVRSWALQDHGDMKHEGTMAEEHRIPSVPWRGRLYPIPLCWVRAGPSHGRWRRLRGPSSACKPRLGCPPSSHIPPLGYSIPAQSILIKPQQHRNSRQKTSFCAAPVHHQEASRHIPSCWFSLRSLPTGQRFPPARSRG